jgi:type I restriction enzyme S subunit
MTEQMNVPKLRFGEFEEQLFLKPFGDLVTDVTYGPRFNADDYSVEGNVRTIRGTDMGNNGEIKYAQVPTAQLDEKTVSRHELKHGDLVMITTADCGVTSVYREQDIKHICSAYAVKIELNKGADSTYFKYFFQTRKAQYEVSRFIRRATVSNLPGSDIKRFRQYPPTHREQQKIASFLSKVDEKIGLLSEKKDKLTEYKRGVIQQLFNGKWQEQDGQITFTPPTLRFKADDGSEFPDWKEMRGGELFEPISNKNHSSDLPVLAITQNQGAVPRDQINYKVSVSESSVASYKVVEKGDFIISLRSFQGGIEYSEYTGICSPAYVILRAKKEISDYFFKLYLKTYPFIVEMQKRLEGIRDGKIISYKYFSEISMPYPSITEQEKIVQFLSTLDQKIELTNIELEKSKEWKKGLLQQMFV